MEGDREGLWKMLETVLTGEKGSASGSRSAEGPSVMTEDRQIRGRALNVLREGREPLSRVEPRMNSSLKDGFGCGFIVFQLTGLQVR